MSEPMPIAQMVDSLERRLAAAEAKLARVLPYGNQLANIAHNLKQADKMSEHEKALLHAAQTGWDEAKRMP